MVDRDVIAAMGPVIQPQQQARRAAGTTGRPSETADHLAWLGCLFHSAVQILLMPNARSASELAMRVASVGETARRPMQAGPPAAAAGARGHCGSDCRLRLGVSESSDSDGG